MSYRWEQGPARWGAGRRFESEVVLGTYVPCSASVLSSPPSGSSRQEHGDFYRERMNSAIHPSVENVICVVLSHSKAVLFLQVLHHLSPNLSYVVSFLRCRHCSCPFTVLRLLVVWACS